MYIEMATKARTMGLEINAEKTKYMRMSVEERNRKGNNFEIGNESFERVSSFIYLGTEVNNKNSINQEIQRRLIAGNRAFYANINLLKSRMLSRKTKLKIYRTLIRPVVTYGAETWNLFAADVSKLRVFERKIVRRIYGPIFENGNWRIRNNLEIEEILDHEDIARFIKSQRLRWLGHVERMSESRATKRVYRASMTGRRKQGRPRNRWKDEVERDLNSINIRGWKEAAKDRKRWKKVVMQAKTHTEL